MIIVGIAGPIFMIVSKTYFLCCFSFLILSSSIQEIQSLVIALSNSYGLVLVVLLLGPGLIELPVK